MKVKELIELLQKVDPDTLVVVRGYVGGYTTPKSAKTINITFGHISIYLMYCIFLLTSFKNILILLV